MRVDGRKNVWNRIGLVRLGWWSLKEIGKIGFEAKGKWIVP